MKGRVFDKYIIPYISGHRSFLETFTDRDQQTFLRFLRHNHLLLKSQYYTRHAKGETITDTTDDTFVRKRSSSVKRKTKYNFNSKFQLDEDEKQETRDNTQAEIPRKINARKVYTIHRFKGEKVDLSVDAVPFVEAAMFSYI